MKRIVFFMWFLLMWIYWAFHFITVPFVKLHEWATEQVNNIDDKLYDTDITKALIQKKMEKESQRGFS